MAAGRKNLREGWLLSAAVIGAALFQPGAHADCGEPNVPLTAVALGDGAEAQPGARVEVEGTVTAAFPGDDGLNGFYIAEAVSGGPPVGLFVYAPGLDEPLRRSLEPGTAVRVSGRVGRYQGQRQVEHPRRVEVCGEAEPVDPVELELPAAADRLARLDGVPVRVDQTLTVIDNHRLGRYGSLTLSSEGRLSADERRSTGARLVLDDGSHATAPDTVPHLDADGTRRVGSRLSGVTGILASTFGRYRVHPTDDVRWAGGNPRKPPAARTPGVLRVAVFNIRNYFARLGRRGAETAAQRRLQRDKLIAAIRRMDADLIALLEVGNSREAVSGLIRAVNTGADHADRYRATLAPGRLGDDGIRVVLAYRPERLRPVSKPRSHESPVFERPLILARFQGAGGRPFSVAAAHFKSKGGCPGERHAVDTAAGCWGERREAQARALLAAMGGKGLGGERWLVLADLNAYSHEPPLAILRRGGLVDAVARHLPAQGRYTYVYRGHSGTLDYVLGSEALVKQIARVQIWHANADEPPFLSYGGGRPAAARAAGAYRSSDHDPVLVDLGGGR